jgi:hypothetical protein
MSTIRYASRRFDRCGGGLARSEARIQARRALRVPGASESAALQDDDSICRQISLGDELVPL